MKFLIELYMDGYESQKDMKQACIEYIQDQLDFSAGSIKILWSEEVEEN